MVRRSLAAAARHVILRQRERQREFTLEERSVRVDLVGVVPVSDVRCMSSCSMLSQTDMKLISYRALEEKSNNTSNKPVAARCVSVLESARIYKCTSHAKIYFLKTNTN